MSFTAKELFRTRHWVFKTIGVQLVDDDTTEIVAAVTKRLRLLALAGTVVATGSIVIKDGTTAVSGIITFAATGGCVLPSVLGDVPPSDKFLAWAETTAGAALNATLAGVGGDWGGIAIYAEEV